MKFMTLSCCIAASYGAATLFVPWSMANTFMFPAAAAASEEGFIAFKFILAATLIGWANGKYQAIRLGPAACVEFCKMNFIPAAILVYASASVGAWDTPVWAAMTACYVYFGYVA